MLIIFWYDFSVIRNRFSQQISKFSEFYISLISLFKHWKHYWYVEDIQSNKNNLKTSSLIASFQLTTIERSIIYTTIS